MQPEEHEEPPEQATKSFWSRQKAWIIIAGALVVLGASVVTYYFLRPAQKTVQSSSTTIQNKTAVSSQSQPQTMVNTWKGKTDAAAIPLGDGKVSTNPQVGYVDSCSTTFRGGGARHAGNWIHSANGTWDMQTKIAVQGSISWPSASYAEATSGSSRVITTNDLPMNLATGIFPISPSDPAYQYDTNPNHIAAQSTNYTLPLNPTAAPAPSCVGLGPIGVLDDGVFLYNALDDGGRDAVAHEVQDSCDGHPDGQERYHYHDVPTCIMSRATGNSTLVGYALDGYGIFVERDAAGNLPTDADLDACHGRTSEVMWDGKITNIYHYDATLEYPYTVGCFHGSPVVHGGPAQP